MSRAGGPCSNGWSAVLSHKHTCTRSTAQARAVVSTGELAFPFRAHRWYRSASKGTAMTPFPADVFTEPTDVDPDTLANLGPLRRLAGGWEARKGVDLNPKAEGPERREFIERIDFQPIDPQANGPQLFYGLRYHIHITTEEEDITFHDQVGYWLWEPATGLVLQTIAIPRGQVAIAAGQATPDSNEIVVTAT